MFVSLRCASQVHTTPWASNGRRALALKTTPVPAHAIVVPKGEQSLFGTIAHVIATGQPACARLPGLQTDSQTRGRRLRRGLARAWPRWDRCRSEVHPPRSAPPCPGIAFAGGDEEHPPSQS